MFYVNEISTVTMSSTLKNSGSTDGATFRPMMAIVDCKTGNLIDRYAGTAKTATSQGVSISYNRTVQADKIVLCYYYCATSVANSVTTFENYSVTCTSAFCPTTVNEPYTAHRLTGDGTVTSLDGVNNIMSSELNFNVSFGVDYVNNPIGI